MSVALWILQNKLNGHYSNLLHAGKSCTQTGCICRQSTRTSIVKYNTIQYLLSLEWISYDALECSVMKKSDVSMHIFCATLNFCPQSFQGWTLHKSFSSHLSYKMNIINLSCIGYWNKILTAIPWWPDQWLLLLHFWIGWCFLMQLHDERSLTSFFLFFCPFTTKCCCYHITCLKWVVYNLGEDWRSYTSTREVLVYVVIILFPRRWGKNKLRKQSSMKESSGLE